MTCNWCIDILSPRKKKLYRDVMSKPKLQPRVSGRGTRTHRVSDTKVEGVRMSNEQREAYSRSGKSNQDSAQGYLSPEDGLYDSELSESQHWNVVVVLPSKRQEHDTATLSFFCVYCCSSVLSRTSSHWRQYEARDLWNCAYPVSENWSSSVLISIRRKWRRHVKSAHRTLDVKNLLTSSSKIVGSFSSSIPALASCIFYEVDFDLGSGHEHHLAKLLRVLASDSQPDAQTVPDAPINNRNAEERLTLQSLRWDITSDELHNTASTSHSLVSSGYACLPISAESSEWEWREANLYKSNKQERGSLSAQFGSDVSYNARKRHEFLRNGAMSVSNCNHALVQDEYHDDALLLQSEAWPESSSRLENPGDIYVQTKIGAFGSEQMTFNLGILPLYDIPRPSILVSDIYGRVTAPLADEDDALLLEDESITTTQLVGLVCDRSHALNMVWMQSLASTQDLQDLLVHCSASISPHSLLESGVRTLKGCLEGILPFTFEDVFALTHVLFAIPSVVHTDGNSCYWEAFSLDVLDWRFAISNAREVALFTRIWSKLWRPEAYEQFAQSEGPLADGYFSSSFPTYSAIPPSLPISFDYLRPKLRNDALVSFSRDRKPGDLLHVLMDGMAFKDCLRFLDGECQFG